MPPPGRDARPARPAASCWSTTTRSRASPRGSGGRRSPWAFDPAETIAAVYAGEAVADRVIKPAGIPGVDLVPGSVRSTRHNVPVPYEADWDAQTCLRSFLDEVRDRYDLILIDCPPNLHLCSWAALVASDYLIVPLQPEDYGAQGIAEVQDSVARVVSGPNPGLRLLGYLITMVQARRSIHQLYEAQLRAPTGMTSSRPASPRPRSSSRPSPAGCRSPSTSRRGPRRRRSRRSPRSCWPGWNRGPLPRATTRRPPDMGKLEELSRLTAGNVQDSIGIGRPARPAEAPAPASAPSAPARWQGVTKSKNAVEIPVEKIAADPDQPREEFDEEALGRLAESLKDQGPVAADPGPLGRGERAVHDPRRGTPLEGGQDGRDCLR